MLGTGFPLKSIKFTPLGLVGDNVVVRSVPIMTLTKEKSMSDQSLHSGGQLHGIPSKVFFLLCSLDLDVLMSFMLFIPMLCKYAKHILQ